MTINRRHFLQGAGGAALAGTLPRLTFAQNGPGFNDEILIYVFLRGGIDGLSLYAPGSGHPDRGFYENLRPSLSVRLPVSGANAMLPLADGFGINRAATGLRDLWLEGDLAIVHATGLPIVNRSHFEAERFIELGTPGATAGLTTPGEIPGTRLTPTGWLTRHLNTATNLPPAITLPAVVTESTMSFSLSGSGAAVALRTPSQFDFNESDSALEEAMETTIKEIYQLDATQVGIAGEQAMVAQEAVETTFAGLSNFDYNQNLVPAARYPTFTNNEGNLQLFSIADKLLTLSRLIKADIGLRIAQVDVNGWDDHTDQGSLPAGVNGSTGNFYNRLDAVSRSVRAFWNDMRGLADNPADFTPKITVVFHSEFGRRAFSNNDNGTDHGSGNPMMLLGGNVNGGQFHGTWPGLAPNQLFQNADVATTNDFRRVLSEVLIRRLGNNRLGLIFPFYYNYEPLGAVNGPDLPPDYGPDDELTRDSFES